jgi:acid stress-induced BolA-like protein IbaG/YrbA
MLGDGEAPAEEVERVYAWFCREQGDVSHFHAYMLRAELADASRVSKRLLHAHVC